MAAGRSSRNNVLAGIFVLVCIILGIVVVIVLSNIGDFLKPTSIFTVRFSVADGAEGLDRGAAVKLGGQRIGRVTETQFIDDPVSGEPAFVDVKIQVPQKLKLYTDADVQLLRPLLGSGSTINIVSITSMARPGVEYAGPPVLLKNGDTIAGRLGPPGFLAQSDYTKFQEILGRVDRITADVEPRVKVLMDDAQATVKNIRSITADVDQRWQTWGPKADTIIAEVEKVARSFEPIVANVGKGVDDVRGRVDQVRDLIATGQKYLDENGPRVTNAIKNVEDLSAKLNSEMYKEVMAAIQTGRTGIAEATAAAKRARELVDENAPQLTDMIANAGLAANQLKLATVEIRSAPWRLLYQPTKKELENELLYNSVRQYSDSVGELQRVSKQIAALAEATEKLPDAERAEPKKRIAEMMLQLQGSFAKYQEQEREFLNRWAKDAK